MNRTEIEIGRGLRDAAGDVASAWKAAEAGSAPAATDRVFVADWTTLHAVLTPERFGLLRHLRRAPQDGVRALAHALGRDEAEVEADVTALVAFGLVERGADRRLSSAVDEIASTVRVAA